MASLIEILSSYLLEPEMFWPEQNYFHGRNREKIIWARQRLEIKSEQDIADNLLPRLLERAQSDADSLFVISTGASGCHFFGSVVASSNRYKLIGEVYFPPRLVEMACEAGNDVSAKVIMDCVSAIPMGRIGAIAKGNIPVNIMHLRPDSPIREIRRLLPQGRLVSLIRNPYDIAVSRSFRKNEYRETANPGVQDSDYAVMQSRLVRNYFSRMKTHKWDAIVRYENLRENPLQVALDVLETAQLPSAGLRYAKPVMDNHNTAPPPDVPGAIAHIIHDNLAVTAAGWHYSRPSHLKFSDLTHERHWVPMARELRINKVLRHIREKQELLVVPDLEGFDPRGSLEDIRLDTRSQTWCMYFWTFCWLHLCPDLQDGEELQLEWLGRAIDLAEEYSITPSAAPDRFWDDHATSYRSATLLYFIHKFCDTETVRSRHAKLGAIFLGHADKLESFLNSSRWERNNHGVFHAMAYINLHLNSDIVIAGTENPKNKLKRGLRSLTKTLSEIIDPETGISREQCFHYHLWSIALLKDVDEFLEQIGLGIGFNVHDLIEKMLAFGRFLMVGDESLPAIGDTAYRSGYKESFIAAKEAELLERPLRNVAQLGIGICQGPFTTVLGTDQEFYAVRLEPGERADASLLIMTNWPARVSHGHFDTLSVWFTKAGAPLLIDSGGPYAYGDQQRFEYFILPQAHNTVVVDRKTYRGGARMIRRGGNESVQFFHACIEDNSGVSHHRISALLETGELLILDQLASLDGESHEVSALFHFPPDAEVASTAAGTGHVVDIRPQEGTTERMFMASVGAELDLRVSGGDQEQAFRGWVTGRQGHMQESPVLIAQMHTKDTFLVSVLEGSAPIDALVIAGGGGNSLEIRYKTGENRILDLNALFGRETDDKTIAEQLSAPPATLPPAP